MEDRAARVPGIARRLASMAYEAALLAAIAFFANGLFLLANAGHAAEGWARHAQQAYLLAVVAAYFMWCWLRGGQTLAMKAWRLRLVAPGRARIPARVALARLVLAGVFVGAFWAGLVAAIVVRNPWIAFATLSACTVGIGWALVDRDRQFLHDRLARTRIELVEPAAKKAGAPGGI